METRALAIALFYALGTGIGGIIGPQLSGPLVAQSSRGPVFGALALGAALMMVRGFVEIIFVSGRG